MTQPVFNQQLLDETLNQWGVDLTIALTKRDQQHCFNCDSEHLEIGFTHPKNPRHPRKPYWRCLSCPPAQCFSHWVKQTHLKD